MTNSRKFICFLIFTKDFGLGLDPNHKPTKEEFISARKIVTERQEFEREETIAYNAFCDYFRVLREYGRIYALQSERMDKLMGKVDFIVTDAPLLLNTIYLNSPDKTAYTKEILDRFNKYDNFCFVVERNTAVFEQEGRIQNLEQSIEKDNDITKLLKDNNIYFKTYNHESLNKVAENAIRTHQRITGIKKETPIGERIQSAKAVGDIIGNTPYKAISDKSYLKYSNAIASQIADKLQQNNVAFSGRVYSNLTTFTVNKKDLDKLRSIAENLTRSFTDRHRPQLIPSFKQQKTIQKQMTAAPRQQSRSL